MPADQATYHETLHAPPVWWLGGLAMATTVWWIFFVVTPWWVALAAGLVTAALVAWTLISHGGVRVEAGADGLHAGMALLPWEHVGPSVALDRDEARRQLGPDADARAYLLVRAYCPGAVKVYVDDESDPTPYWIVSSRRATDLADHLNRRIVRD